MDILITDTTPASQIVTASSLTLNLSRPPRAFYRHGWQSWSLAAWTDLSALPIQKPVILHPLQGDPLYAFERRPHGSWLGAVEFEDGKILLLGALGMEARVRLSGGRLEGWYETGQGEWLIAHGEGESVFRRYAGELGKRFGFAASKPAPRVWCSWYSLYTAIDEPALHRIFDGLGDLPFDVLQVDDGWQAKVGDWEANEKFPSGMAALAAKIKAGGRRAGLWLAPLIAAQSSRLFRERPDWFLKDEKGKFVSAGFNWDEWLYALDSTHPAVLDWLAELMMRTRTWGYDYLKLDFLYAGALPGKRHVDMPREAAYRHALEIMRRAAGDAYLLVCGAPILPSLGLCDAMRVGPDVANAWDSRMYSYLLYNQTTPGVKNAIRATVNRLWLKPLVQVDPDVAYFHESQSLTAEQRQLFQDLTEICGFKATSDLPATWTKEERENVRRWLETPQESKRAGRYAFTVGGRAVDFAPAMDLPPRPTGFAVIARAVVSWLSEQPWALRLWNRVSQAKPERASDQLMES